MFIGWPTASQYHLQPDFWYMIFISVDNEQQTVIIGSMGCDPFGMYASPLYCSDYEWTLVTVITSSLVSSGCGFPIHRSRVLVHSCSHA